MKKAWLVARASSRGGPGFNRFDSRKAADANAKQQAAKNPGVGYFIYEAVGYAEMPAPTVEVVEVQ